MDPAEMVELSMMSRQSVEDDASAHENSSTQLFYSTAVFITGGSGFLGKQLIEKLFRSCKIRKVFLLIRPKKGKDPQQRLTEMLKDPVFDLVRKNQPEFQANIVIIEGDMALPRLGISDDNWNTLTKEVTVIFHGAATLRFDEPLQTAVIINVRGTREVLQLGHACRHLRSLVYISTAFSHATSNRINGEVLEQFYPVPVLPETVILLAEVMNASHLDKIASSLMEDWPNTYCFSKALAEELVRTKGADLPVCIVRPAIIIGAYQEPTPGWIDPGNLYGASGMLLGFIMGIIHVNFSKPKGKMDFVPVDMVNNAVISAGMETGKRWDDGEREIKIYAVTSERNVLSPEGCVKILHTEFRKLMSPKAFWYMYVFLADNIIMYSLLSFFSQDVPARIVDCVAYFMGKKPKLTSLYKKVHKMTEVLKYFSINVWTFSDQNLLQIYKNMSETDRAIFNFDMATVSKRDMMVVWSLGLRKYVIKDKLKGTEYGVKKQKYFKIVTFIFIIFFIFFSSIMGRYLYLFIFFKLA